MILEQRAALDERHHEIETLKLYILKLKRMKFGRSSEKLEQQIEQLELRLEDLEAAEAAKQSSEASSVPSSVPANVTFHPICGKYSCLHLVPKLPK